MRDTVIELIQDTDTGVFTLSQELPYEVDGMMLYEKNAKKIYVDLAQILETSAIPTLDNNSILNQTTTINVYFSCEASRLPSYDEVITNLKMLKDAAEIRALGYHSRTVEVTTAYVDNLLVTTLQYQFTKLI
jgi:hypothetical protein